MIEKSSLTNAQSATLSNTICGDPQSAYELQELGLVENIEIESRSGRTVAFFDLTEAGEAFVDRHYVVPCLDSEVDAQ